MHLTNVFHLFGRENQEVRKVHSLYFRISALNNAVKDEKFGIGEAG